MSDMQRPEAESWGPEWHRKQQIRAWASATPARRFAWLEEMLDWLRERDPGNAGKSRDRRVTMRTDYSLRS